MIDAVYLQCDDGDERDSCEYERYYVGLFVRDACGKYECACTMMDNTLSVLYVHSSCSTPSVVVCMVG